ncbi:hypothetical protein [Pseudonocardia sp. MH-G8]|uniref:hypothetical protein n=1 Tax=Pseudonocardia sp. MH-G8 TaxID=1854588 RepID=UPI000BA0559A|nr:hypothetical protein [Pseudonocardia sp. MH-G8]OZM82792.1 hypothetical protein CFP66_08915 [Pseudonocardia sp. MH-G8]
MEASGSPKPPRTLLEAKIRERNMTLEEFAEYAETFARENGETGTLSVRQLQRLLAPRLDRPAGMPRPATRRLLEGIFGAPTLELLGPPTQRAPHERADFAEWEVSAAELNRLVATAERVDVETLRLLADQIENTRRLDRRFGATALLGALRLHAQHIEALFAHCTNDATTRALAAVLTDAHTLAGWQSLDRGEVGRAWDHYQRACDAARAADSAALHAHALAEQAVVLADIGRTTDGAAVSSRAREIGRGGPPLLCAWLAAAHGEALAADGQQNASLHAYTDAELLLPVSVERDDKGPYLALDSVHLARWRGHALARFGCTEAVTVLSKALIDHDVEFSRAEAGLRVDLALAYLACGEHDAAREQRTAASGIAEAVGSARQRRRLQLVATGALGQKFRKWAAGD